MLRGIYMSGELIEFAVPFPQHPRKHREESLFTAREFHRYASRRTGSPPPKPPRNVVLVYGHRWKRYLSRKYRAASPSAGSGDYRANDSVGVSIVGGPGAPHSAIVVEEMAALGVRRFLIVGMAGSLQPDLRVGSLVACDKALRDEGTSHHYVRPSVFAYPSSELTAALVSTLEREGTPYAKGPTWTTDAPYRETVAEVRRYRQRGILTVEMEASAVFSVARFRGRQAAAIFVISDHLDERGWEPRFYDCRPGLRHALDLAVEALAA